MQRLQHSQVCNAFHFLNAATLCQTWNRVTFLTRWPDDPVKIWPGDPVPCLCMIGRTKLEYWTLLIKRLCCCDLVTSQPILVTVDLQLLTENNEKHNTNIARKNAQAGSYTGRVTLVNRWPGGKKWPKWPADPVPCLLCATFPNHDYTYILFQYISRTIGSIGLTSSPVVNWVN
jgi:hypothetical protein